MKAAISRRNFLKTTVCTATGLAAAGMLSACSSTSEQATSAAEPASSEAQEAPAEETGIQWDDEYDVVVIGAGGAGLPAALKAMEGGASVLLVEANWDCGGHAAVSEGNLHNGAGIEAQTAAGIVDSADLYYFDHTRGVPLTTRYNDRAYVRSIANAMAESFDFFLDNGIKILDREPTGKNYYKNTLNANEPESVPRQTYTDASDWENPFTGTSVAGIGVTRPLEMSLRNQGAKFLLNYHMDKLYREEQFSGKVIGIQASYTPHIMPGETARLESEYSEGNLDWTKETVNIKANKGVIIATGGSTGNQTFRTMFDPRLGPEFDGLGGMPFSDQDASGEMAAMQVGAALGCAASYQMDGGGQICTPKRFGCRYGYGGGFNEKSKVWPLVHANGVAPDFESLCIVNMLGQRCGNEDKYNTGKYVEDRFEFFDTAFSSVIIDPEGDGNAECFGGPLWAIFDQDACDRNDWNLEQGIVDYDDGYAFKADTLEELAQKVVNKYYEDIKMNPEKLVETITRYNTFVENGNDEDWGKKSLTYKIEKGPFYALWAMPSLHDTLAGLRVDGSMQVIDMQGNVIPGLFCAGESSGGMRIHGLGRVMTSGYIAGRSAASVDANGYSTASNALNPAYAGTETPEALSTSKASDVTYTAPENPEEVAAKSAASTAAAQQPAAAANTFVGTSQKGIGGAIQVQITVNDGKMTAIEVLQQKETEGIGTAAFDPLIQQALNTQSSQLDAVSGATITSNAFMEALATAMKKAGL
jgi:uncharacterized protein with FMN-binding domain/predicted oxidoreductase